ncbi:MAG: RagB/SusD family nutrient uptake outer membrane protein [Bacteroidaceae bacterium]|nr:RagB/SusD family nutrient uptake outer membrane protein [Bacteroidaceae bacterium]
MITTRLYKILVAFCVGGAFSAALTSCSGFLYDDSDQIIYADDHSLNSDADTLWSVTGIMNKMQAVADRTILLGEVRADLVSLTGDAPAALQQMADFNMSAENAYNQPRDYYAIINNCNFFLSRADTALRDGRNKHIFLKEYAAVKAFRAWTYLQLALNYRRVPFITEPILAEEESEQQFTRYDLQQICQYFIADIEPYADIELPDYQKIRNTDSRLFYYPIYVLLGDLNLWAGNYRAAAENYYKYLSTRNGTNSSYPLSTNAVRFSNNDSHWTMMLDTWSPMFSDEKAQSSSEIITMIPGDSIPSEGNYSLLRDLFNTTENNNYRAAIRPSQAIINLSKAQKYCQFTTGGEFVFAPDNLSGNRSGDLRLAAAYNEENGQQTMNGKTIDHFAAFTKYQTAHVHVLRRVMVYLRLAEALNRAGFPRFAFQILKQGINNNVIENEVLPYYPADEAWLRTFDFPNIAYILETTAGQLTENTMGIHSRGCGYSAYNTAYELPDDASITDEAARLQYQIEHVEDLIVDESALELAFEGQRFYDLMRVALRRGTPDYLASRVARRTGSTNASLLQHLSDSNNWYLNLDD